MKEGRKYEELAKKIESFPCDASNIITSMESIPEIVVIHSFSSVFTSLNSTAPARLGACGLKEPHCSVCRADGSEASEVDGTASSCLKQKSVTLSLTSMVTPKTHMHCNDPVKNPAEKTSCICEHGPNLKQWMWLY